jgi:hypothetical protein
VDVNLPVRQDAAPDPNSGYYVDDHLALSVLAPNVPIPASSDPNASFSGWFPAWSVGQERCCPLGDAGATILFNADWSPAASAKACKKAKKGAAAAKKKKKCGKRKKKKRK